MSAHRGDTELDHQPVLRQYLATGGAEPFALALAIGRAHAAAAEYQAACDAVTELLTSSPEAMRLWLQEGP